LTIHKITGEINIKLKIFILYQFLALLLTLINKKYGLVVSLSLPFFWFICFISFSIRLYNKLSTNYNDLLDNDLASGPLQMIIYLIFSLLLLILSNIPDKSSTEVINKQKTIPSCPLKNESLFSRLTFYWMFKLLVIGVKDKIDISYLYPLCSYLRSNKIYNEYENGVKKQNMNNVNEKRLKLGPILWGAIYKSYLYGCFFELLSIVFSYGSPFMLRYDFLQITFIISYFNFNFSNISILFFSSKCSLILDFLSNGNEQTWYGVIYVIAFISTIILDCTFDTHQFYFMYLSAIKAKSILISAI
jgi:hypothetical protein